MRTMRNKETVSMLTTISAALLLATVLGGAASLQAAQMRGNSGGVAFSFVGHVNNQPPNGVGNTSNQFGYFDSVDGLDSVFTSSNPTMQDEHTAMFTFNVDAVTVRKKLNGQISIGTREGTLTVYQVDDPSMTDFATPATFKQGTPVMTASLEQQVIVDIITGTFYVTNTLTVTDVELCIVNGQPFRLARNGQVLIFTYSGRSNTIAGTTAPSGFFAGFAVKSRE